MSNAKKEKISLNGIPVYRTVEEDGDIRYVLFEDNPDRSHVINIHPDATREEEYSIILEQIAKLVRPSNIDPDKDFKVTVLIQEYEQSKRNKQWLQKPAAQQTGVVIRG